MWACGSETVPGTTDTTCAPALLTRAGCPLLRIVLRQKCEVLLALRDASGIRDAVDRFVHRLLDVLHHVLVATDRILIELSHEVDELVHLFPEREITTPRHHAAGKIPQAGLIHQPAYREDQNLSPSEVDRSVNRIGSHESDHGNNNDGTNQ